LFYGVKQKKHNHGFPEVFLTKMVFLFWFSKGFPNKNGIFVLVFQRKTCVPSKTLGRDTRLENLCPNKNYVFEGRATTQVFLRKTFLFTPFPRKGAGKGYQVRKLTKTVS